MNKEPDDNLKTDTADTVLALAEERLNVSRRQVTEGRIRVTRSTSEHVETVNMLLKHQSAEVKRVAKSEYVDVIPPIREEEGVTIVPVVEEVIETVRKLVLREEVHIRTMSRQVPYEENVTLRKQTIEIRHDQHEPQSNPVTQERIMAHEKIATLFGNIAQAEGAKRNLIKAGYHEHDIDIISGERLRSEDHETRHPGLWQRLFGDKVDDEQAEVYEEAISTGGVVLTLRAEEDQLPRALGIIDAHETGLTDRTVNATQTGTLSSTPEISTAADNSRTDAVRTSLTGDESEEDILRLAEEHLEVGKRLISEGSTRVRRYTVTEDVSRDISLQEQHADVFRRPLNETATPGNIDWSDKTVEIEETHEQPVINKTAHVKEEVVVRTDVTDRVETIKDSVRRQEVDIDHADSVAAKEYGLHSAATDVPESGNVTSEGVGSGVSLTSEPVDKKETFGEKVSDKITDVKKKL